MLQQLDQALPIIGIGRGDHDCYKESECIDQKMTLASFDFLVPVKAAVCALRAVLILWLSTQPSGRLGQPPLPLALLVT